MASTLTPTQANIHGFMLCFQRERSRPPSSREISIRFGKAAHSAVQKHLHALVRKGWAKKTGVGEPCLAIDPDDPQKRFLRIGVFDAQVGESDEPAEFIHVDISTFCLDETASEDLKGVRISDDSMSGAHLVAGDIALIHYRSASQNEIVVYRAGNEWKIRRLLYEQGRRFYRAENPQYPDKRYQQHEGVLVGVIRRVMPCESE